MDLFHFEHAMVADVGNTYQLIQKFIALNKGDIFLEKIDIIISKRISFKDVVYKIRDMLEQARVVSHTLSPGHFVITGTKGGNPILVLVENKKRDYDDEPDGDDDAAAHHLTASFYGNPAMVEALREICSKSFVKERMAAVNWWFQGAHGVQSHKTYIPIPKTKLYPEFYPDIGDPYKFMDDYLSSDAAVLMLAGTPGTGKTTLLRHMIAERKLSAHIIYDEKLMTNDTIFQNFLFSQDSDIMIIEDADTILTAREDDGNKMMSRFLSVSDGLIKLPNKKLVFTTNITDFNKVDAALVRPGRCHAVVHTRPLNLQEAQAAAKVAGLPVPEEKGEYTLAELFNQGYRPKLRAIGFGARH